MNKPKLHTDLRESIEKILREIADEYQYLRENKPVQPVFHFHRLYSEKLVDKLETLIKMERREAFKKAKEAGINSTYPVVNLDDETKNCLSCGHDHSVATKDCRCSCCIDK